MVSFLVRGADDMLSESRNGPKMVPHVVVRLTAKRVEPVVSIS